MRTCVAIKSDLVHYTLWFCIMHNFDKSIIIQDISKNAK